MNCYFNELLFYVKKHCLKQPLSRMHSFQSDNNDITEYASDIFKRIFINIKKNIIPNHMAKIIINIFTTDVIVLRHKETLYMGCQCQFKFNYTLQ